MDCCVTGASWHRMPREFISWQALHGGDRSSTLSISGKRPVGEPLSSWLLWQVSTRSCMRQLISTVQPVCTFQVLIHKMFRVKHSFSIFHKYESVLFVIFVIFMLFHSFYSFYFLMFHVKHFL